MTPRRAVPDRAGAVTRRLLVTGAGSGIGLATALEAAEAGFSTVALVPDDQEDRAVREAAAARGVDLRTVQVDLSDATARAAVASDLRPWGLVNNAGYLNAGRVRDIPIADARRQIEAMVLAPVDLARQALPAMVSAGDGRIVNVTSSALHTATPLSGWYQACKAALRELNDSLRIELAGSGVHVVEVEPGGYRTEIWPRATRELAARRHCTDEPDLYDRVAANLERFRARMGDPARVARVVVNLLTDPDPPAHRRVGADAPFLRLASDFVPTAAWDWLVNTVARRRAGPA